MRRSRFNLLKHKQQAWVYVVGCLFVADFAIYGYLPAHRRLETLQHIKRQDARLIETAQSQRQALPQLKQMLETTLAAVAHYEQSVPSSRALVPFQRQITDIMTENGLTDQEIIPQADIQADELNCISVRMNCKGRLEGVFGFCRAIQGMDRLVRIETLKLRNDTNFTGQVYLEAEAVIFYRSENVQARQSTHDAAYTGEVESGA